MTLALMQAISNGREAREAQSDEFKMDLVFAKLEVVELQAGIRGLLDCPAIERIANMINDAKKHARSGDL